MNTGSTIRNSSSAIQGEDWLTPGLFRFGASSLLTLIEMVDADLGITFLPEMARGSTLLRNTRVSLHAMREASYRTIGLAWRKGSRRTEEFRLLGQFLESCHTRAAAA